LFLALVFRIIRLFCLSWLIGLTAPVFTAFGRGISWRDIVLITGGLFLLFKATHEIHNKFEHDGGGPPTARIGAAFAAVIVQVCLIDIVFSVDSIITAIGMAQQLPVMIAAVVISMIFMYLASGPIGGFIHRHSTTKMLALAFLILIVVSLVADGAGLHIPRGYIYFAMAFDAGVETINVLAKQRRAKMKVGPQAH
jgi:predicted tellurium resistance membrane protein TerC